MILPLLLLLLFGFSLFGLLFGYLQWRLLGNGVHFVASVADASADFDGVENPALAPVDDGSATDAKQNREVSGGEEVTDL